MPFPLSPVPSWYSRSYSHTNKSTLFYDDATVGVTLDKAGATAYTVRDYWGNIVSTGTLDGATTFVQPTPPAGGWPYGWYRIFFTGPNTDTLFGDSYSITNFTVVPSDSRFLTMPAFGQGAMLDATGDTVDFGMKGPLGAGTSRIVVSDVTSSSQLTTALAAASLAGTYWTNPGSQYLDPNRPRYLWAALTGTSADFLALPNNASGTYCQVFPKDGTIDGTKVFVAIAAGSTSGAKITVSYPDASTVVETYDNEASSSAMCSAINAASSYLYAQDFPGSQTSPGTQAATAIGNTYRTATANVVSQLYDAGITHFEGPGNEHSKNAATAHLMQLFIAAVKDGNASAKAIGPCFVDVSDISGWTAFLAECNRIGTIPDEVSSHMYNVDTWADPNLTRSTMEAWTSLLATYGWDSLPRWQTESTQAMTATYGIHHPRHARREIFQTLILEEFEIVREKNNPWYDQSHGFWSFPTWCENFDGSLQPQMPMHYTLARETWGETYDSRLTFPGLADDIFCGWVYKNGTSSQTVVLLCASPGDNTVTLSTSAAGTLNVTDAFGNVTTANVTNGKVTVSVSEIPTYIDLPGTATVAVENVNGWDFGTVSLPDAVLDITATVDGVDASTIVDGTFLTDYTNQTNIFRASGNPPSTVELTWHNAALATRLLIWCGAYWQNDSVITDMTVDVTYDGTTWTTDVASYSQSISSFQAGSDSNNVGCKLETFDDPPWWLDVPLSLSGPILGLRINVSATSYGGEPDAATVGNGGQGDSAQHVVLQRVAILGQPSSSIVANTVTFV